MAERGVFSAQERVLLADDHKGNHVLDVILLGIDSSLFLKDMNEIEDMFTPGVVSKQFEKIHPPHLSHDWRRTLPIHRSCRCTCLAPR